MALNLRTLWKHIVPARFATGEGELVGYVQTLIADATLERVYLGHLARFPQQDANGTPGPTDALNALGRDRGVIRGIDETDRSYAYRLTQWLVDARTRGAAFTMLKQVAAYVDFDGSKGASFRCVDNSGNWFSRSATGVETSSLATGNWNWDGDSASWARFWIIVYPGTRWALSGATWGDAGAWGDGSTTWGSTSITDEQAKTLRAIVADWKPAGTRCQNIIIALDPSSFDPAAPEPDGTWGAWSKVSGGVRVAARLSTARYLDGTTT